MFLFPQFCMLGFPKALLLHQTKSHCQTKKWPTMYKELSASLFLEIKKKKPKGLLSKLMEKLKNLKFLRDKKTSIICLPQICQKAAHFRFANKVNKPHLVIGKYQ